ncbi:hypothetical protein C8R46DRAFT_1062003, partial [Mycena filopes]
MVCAYRLLLHTHILVVVLNHKSFVGYNHSGKRGQVNFLNGIMGVANAQRTLDYIRIIAEFISQPEYAYAEVVQLQMFGVVNEGSSPSLPPSLPPLQSTNKTTQTQPSPPSAIGRPQLSAFYLEAYITIRASHNGYGRGQRQRRSDAYMTM